MRQQRLQRARVGFGKQHLQQRLQGLPFGARLGQPVLGQQAHQPHEALRLHMAAGRDGAHAAFGHGGEDLVVFAREHLQPAVGDHRARLGHVAAAVLDAADARVFGQRQHRLARDGHAGAVGDVIDQHGHRAGIGDGVEPLEHAGLRRADVVRRGHQQARQGAFRELARPRRGLAQVVARHAHHDRQAAGGGQHGVEHGELLGLVERGGLAGRAAGHEAGHAVVGEPAHERRQGGVVDRAVAERGDEGDPHAREIGGGVGGWLLMWHAGFLSGIDRWKEPPSDARATQEGPKPWQVPSLIRRRNLGSGQTSFGFLALLPWRARAWPSNEGERRMDVRREGMGCIVAPRPAVRWRCVAGSRHGRHRRRGHCPGTRP